MACSFIDYIRSHATWRTIMAIPRYAAHLRQEWIDASFDRKHHTDTGGIIDDMGELDVHNKHRENAFGYQGIQIPIFRRIMADLNIDPRGFKFIDFGSGKGRAVMMAAKKRFMEVHGVEFSPVLHQIALRNAEFFRQRDAKASPITLHCQDAAEFGIPEGDLVCFFYNPFDIDVMRKVLDNLSAAYAKAPRRIMIAYRNPVYADALKALSYLKPVCANSSYHIFKTQ